MSLPRDRELDCQNCEHSFTVQINRNCTDVDCQPFECPECGSKGWYEYYPETDTCLFIWDEWGIA